MGNRPDFRIIQKIDGKWQRIGAAWKSDRGGFSLSIGERGKEIKYLMKEEDYGGKSEEPGIFQEAIKTIENETGGLVEDEIPF